MSMSMRPKTVRRLIIVATCLLLAGVAVFVVIRVRLHQQEQQRLALRAEGLAAFKQGDYEKVLQPLSKYLTPAKNRDDAEALFAFGKSRSRIELPEGKHIVEAIGFLRRCVEVQPDHAEARRLLMSLYVLAGYNTETISLADAMLAANPDDIDALKAKARALTNMRQWDEALAVSERWNQAAPLDLEGQYSTYTILAQRHPYQELLKRAEAARDAHPDDARFELLLAYACYHASTQDAQAAAAMRQRMLVSLSKCAEANVVDAVYVRELTRLLDTAGLYDRAEQVLTKAASASDASAAAEVLPLLIQRYWQAGRYDQVAQRLKDLDPASRRSDRDLLALRATSLYELGQAEQAKPIVDALDERQDDEAALAWSAALRARYAQPALDARSAVGQYRNALLRSPNNLVIQLWMGQAYAQLGETELALRLWRTVADASPSWPAPRMLIARALAAAGQQGPLAVREAEQAFARQRSMSAAIVLAMARYAQADLSDPAQVKDLLALVGEIQQKAPLEPQTLAIHVALLSRSGQRDAAVAAINAAVQANPALDSDTLLRLATTSRAQKLGLEQSVLQHAEKVHGLTPAVALFRASALAADGKAQDGLIYLRNAANSVPSGADAARWQLALAGYRESINDPDARDAWIRLGEQAPNDLAVQSAILQSAASVWSDRPFVQKTIDRVRELTGQEGLLWRLARARWLLGSEMKERDSAEAVFILTEVVRSSSNLVEPHRLLAAALENVGNAAGAIEQLKKVVELNGGGDAKTLVNLTSLLHAQGRLTEAQPYLDRLAAVPNPDADLRRALAQLYAQQGQYQRAQETLGTQGIGDDPTAQLLSAELLRKEGKVDQARQLYLKLLEAPKPDVALISSAAAFFASQRDLSQAQQVLDRLGQMQLRPGQAQTIRAQFAERWSDRQTAAQHYRAATQQAPDDAGAWRQWIAFMVRSGDYAGAQAAADEAAKAVSGDSELAALRQQVQAMQARLSGAAGQADLQLLHEALAEDPSSIPATEALRVLDDAARLNEPSEATLAKLRQLADSHPRFLPLQLLLIRRYLQADRVSDATTLVDRTVEAFPASADAARLGVAVYQGLERWPEMLLMAQKWRQRALDRPLQADLAIVDAYIRLRRPTEALGQLAPYLDEAKRNPDEYQAVLADYARVLALARRGQEAADLLSPLLSQSASWRQVWLMVATSGELPPNVAVQWLEQVAPLVPADSYEQQLLLARAWHDLAQNSGNPKAYERARDILKQYSDRADTAEAMLVLGSACEALGDAAGAEAAYRRLLQLSPDSAPVRNNLAMLLIGKGPEHAAEARALADQAVATARKVGDARTTAAYLDTRARVLMHLPDQIRAATADFEEALRLQPNYVDSLIGLADAYARSDRHGEARGLLDRVDTLVPDKTTLPDSLRRQLEAVRRALSSAPATGGAQP